MSASAARPGVTWLEGLTASLVVAVALAGTVTLFVRNGETTSDNAGGVRDLGSSLTTVSTATPVTTPAPFVAQDAGFSAVFPAAPGRGEEPIQAAGVSLHAIVYTATTSDEFVGIESADVSAAPTGNALKAGLDGAVDGTARSTKGTVVSRTMTTAVGVPAEDAVITAPSSAVIHVRALFQPRKVFVLFGMAQKDDSPRPAYEQMLATFRPL